MKKYRNEWKYHCAQSELAAVEQRLAAVLERDSHAGEDGRYGVHSLYFDDLYNTCASDTQSGLGRRYKYRIRYYGSKPEYLRLERKEKLNGKRCIFNSARRIYPGRESIANVTGGYLGLFLSLKL